MAKKIRAKDIKSKEIVDKSTYKNDLAKVDIGKYDVDKKSLPKSSDFDKHTVENTDAVSNCKDGLSDGSINKEAVTNGNTVNESTAKGDLFKEVDSKEVKDKESLSEEVGKKISNKNEDNSSDESINNENLFKVNKKLQRTEYLLEVDNLKKWYPIKDGVFSKVSGNIKAVDGVSFNIKSGETFGIVGESGCGKSTLGRTIIRSIESTSGKIIFDGVDITKLNKKELKDVRTKMKFIFQDPYASLNPRMTVKDIIAEPIDIEKTYKTSEERDRRIEKVMDMVGLNKKYMKRYPHEFSGGQRQRIGIARAIILEPKLIICDEPVSALDVSVQAKIINLLKQLQRDMGMAYIFISHDLSVVKHIADKVAVMYLGKIVEISDKKELYDNPKHPYTKALFSAIPRINGNGEEEMVLEGDLPSPANPPSGCRFHTRCSRAQEICSVDEPELRMAGDGHLCACHFA